MQISEENIKTACDGAMALSVLSQPSDKTAVVITDLEMPSKNGYELITSLRKESHLRHLKIILTTGVDRREDAELDKFLRLHFIVYYLRKDEVTPEKLQTALEKIFDRWGDLTDEPQQPYTAGVCFLFLRWGCPLAKLTRKTDVVLLE